MPENTKAGSKAIGDPVVAEDEDGDVLTYTLVEAPTLAFFDIDPEATGHRSRPMWSLSWTSRLDECRMTYDSQQPILQVTVRATDPADPCAPRPDFEVPEEQCVVDVPRSR